MILTRYILYILKKVSHTIPPSSKPCIDLPPEPNIESELPNAVIRGRIGCRKLGKILCISEFITNLSETMYYTLDSAPLHMKPYGEQSPGSTGCVPTDASVGPLFPKLSGRKENTNQFKVSL